MVDSTHLRHRSSRKFAAVLASRGYADRVVELPDSTRTAAEAARAVGCDVGQIVKSLVFRSSATGEPILALVSGANRVDETWMARYVGAPLARADPEHVRSLTGYAIGGVPPVGHASALRTFIDLDLLERSELWAAAGHPQAICRLSPRELLELTRGRPVPVVPQPHSTDEAAPWVTFDCYGTLVDWRTGLLEALRRVGGLPASADGDGLFRRYLVEEQRLEQGPYRPYREVMAEALLRATESQGTRLSRSDAAALPESIPTWPLFPDTRAALRRLSSRGVHLAVLSNNDEDLLRATLSANDLHVTISVSAERVKAYKPALAHWARFLKESGARPEHVWHASGGYEYDLPPAAAFGLRTVYVARYEPLRPGLTADVVVPDLDELATLRLRENRAESEAGGQGRA